MSESGIRNVFAALALAALSAVLAGAVGGGAASASSSEAPQAKPNIVVVMTDDQAVESHARPGQRRPVARPAGDVVRQQLRVVPALLSLAGDDTSPASTPTTTR